MFLDKALLTGYETAPRREVLLLPQSGLAAVAELLGVGARPKFANLVLDHAST